MDVLESILSRIRETSGIDINVKPLSDEEFAQMKCDSFNRKEGNLHEYDGYHCELCKNKGSFLRAEKINGIYTEVLCECECQKTRRSIRAMMKSGLKNIIEDYTFEKFDTAEIWQVTLKEKALEFVKNHSGKWFFIGGQSGCGKTHICTAIAGEFLKARKNVRYMVWRDDIAKIKGCITDAEAYAEIMNTYKAAEVLYIDDLFKNGKGFDGKVQPPTGADIQAAFEILNYRYNNKHLITIISSERSLYELVKIDEALGGRISEMTFDKGFGFNIKKDRGKNYRLRNITEL